MAKLPSSSLPAPIQPVRQPTIIRPDNYAGPEKGRAHSLLSPSIGLFIAEICSNMEPLAVVMRRYGINKQQFRALLAQPVFRQAVSQQRQVFASAANLPDRIRLKAQLAVEDLIQNMYMLASGTAPNTPAAAQVAAFNQIKNLTGLEKPEAPAPKQKFALTINVAPSNGGSGEIIEAIHEEVDVAEEVGQAALADEDALSVTVANGGWNSGIARPVGDMRNPPPAVEIINSGKWGARPGVTAE